MCGRYQFSADEYKEIRQIVRDAQRRSEGNELNFPMAGDICPSQVALVLVSRGEKIVGEFQQWGLPGFRGRQQIINSVYNTLIENHVECLSEPQYFDFRADGFGESRAFYFRDPDGIILEMMQPL